MAHIDKNKKLRPSILDRLLDDEPHNQSEQDTGREQKLIQLRNSVRRDLETLLNTRYRVIEPPEEFEQLEHSLLNYGLPDLATVNTLDIKKKKEFTQSLEKLLKDFEPRFKSVKVKFLDNKDNHDRTLRFSIDAVLYADPYPEMIVFDSVLEPVTRTVNVEEVR
ncbi:type VI secretion system baseplate subunit TssE [Aliikangiella sp. IMCC44359]|uniref:type VI secretion system baseplate subunit TssE n=1 Tax=Aliikangiella sp. IMCC44359 TaxID=3459125 RepID=UPI00403A826D